MNPRPRQYNEPIPTPDSTQARHTPEPWTFDRHEDWSEWRGNITGHYGVDEQGHRSIRTISCQTKYGPVDEQIANGERIVACVNALAGLNPEAVKDVVEALEKCVSEFDIIDDLTEFSFKEPQWWSAWSEVARKARAALAKLKG